MPYLIKDCLEDHQAARLVALMPYPHVLDLNPAEALRHPYFNVPPLDRMGLVGGSDTAHETLDEIAGVDIGAFQQEGDRGIGICYPASTSGLCRPLTILECLLTCQLRIMDEQSGGDQTTPECAVMFSRYEQIERACCGES